MARRALLLLLMVLPAVAQDRTEDLRKLLKAMDACIAAGDEAAAAGKTDDALAQYAHAVQLYEKAMAGRARAAPQASRWDPPADLVHLEKTPAELRKAIDALVAVMMDPQAGSKSLDAQRKLIAIGKPAFPRVLGAMAAARERLTDQDTMDERLLESSLKLADECLRAMDGYLDSKEKAVIRPGVDRKYVMYILRLHYRRWNEVLKDLDTMPGPCIK